MTGLPLPIPLPPSIPRTGGPVRRAVGRLGLRLARWRIAGTVPDCAKMVLVVAPHSSNWDFIVGICAKWALSLDATFLGKDSLFRPPFGAIFRALGGIPVDRSRPNNMVSATVEAFERRERMILVIAPEGTRRKVSEWRTGFYHIARGAGVPILAVAFDWSHRTIRLGPLVTADRPVDEGVAYIRSLFADARGRRGETA